MRSSQYRRRIITIVFLVIIISIILFLISYNFFTERDMRENLKLREIETIEKDKLEDYSDERIYHLIFDKNDRYSVSIKDKVERSLLKLKVKYTVSDISNIKDIKDNDYMVLTARNWSTNKDTIDYVLSKVTSGASLLVTRIPGEDALFSGYAAKFGIYEKGLERRAEYLKITDDVILGLKKGEKFANLMLEDQIYDIHIRDEARVYLTDESDIPIYYTLDYGKGRIGVFNGENLDEREFEGLIPGMLGTLADDFIYPIINSGVVFLDDWPAPFNFVNEDVYEQYGMDFDDFLKYVWWPDMLGLIKKFDIRFTGTFVLSYNDNQEPPYDVNESISDSPMYVHYQQIIKNGGEICIHGYNHYPLWFSKYSDESLASAYSPWESKDNAKEAVEYAIGEFHKTFPKYRMNCYVPPSNVIDETGVEVVKESMGTPIVIAALFAGDPPHQPNHEFIVEDDVIYFPRLSSGSKLDDDTILGTAFGMTSHGVLSHFFHPDDVIDEERSEGMEWEEMRLEYDKMFSFFEERYPYLEYNTISDCANKLVDWYELDYSVVYASDYIKITSLNAPDEYSMILRTDKKITGGKGYSYQKAGDRSYYIRIAQPEVTINLKGES